MSRKWIYILLAASAIAGIAVLVALARQRSDQTPRYTVEDQRRGFEIRRYQPRIAAEVTVTGEDAQAAADAGFDLLFDYISGENATQTEIPMTDRVDRSAVGDEWTIGFTMPPEYTVDTLPQPDDERIQIRQIPATTYAASRFSGRARQPKVERETAELRARIAEAGLMPIGSPPILGIYDPPWIPPLLRRNEILIELESDSN
jgi:hypothetical protein